MKKTLKTVLCMAAPAFILFTGCVPTKKYKASQADLSRVRDDSAKLAQQVTTLNGNVQDLQNKNTALQTSLDNATSKYTTQQKSLDYYQDYFKAQQSAMAQVGEDIKGALTQAGISNADVQQMNDAIYVRLDENELFKKNSTVVTPGGKKALDNLAGVINNRSNVNVFVSRDSTGGPAGADGNVTPMDNMSANASGNASSNSSGYTKPRHHKTHHPTATSTASAGTNATATTSGTSGSAPAPKKVRHRSSPEGSMAFNNGTGFKYSHEWGLTRARMVTVANHFLQNGVQKVNVSLQKPDMNNPNANPHVKMIKVILAPKMNDFNPPGNASAATSER